MNSSNENPQKTEIMNVSTSRLGICEVCNIKAAIYTCPNCEVKTCCLKCSTVHKNELHCDSMGNSTKFIPVNKFTNLDLSRDVRFLENLTRNISSLKTKTNRSKIHKELPYHLDKLQKAARNMNITLKFLPQNFIRHKNNTTIVNFKSNIIYWHIDLIFCNAENTKFTEKRVSENTRLGSIISKYFLKLEDAVLQEKMQYYQSADLSGIKLLLKAEEKHGHQYFELDADLSLKENLINKTIIEHPTILVILKIHGDSYKIIDSDGEEEKIVNGKEVVNRIIKKNEDSLDNSLKNLLFISEYSENEISE